MTPPFEAWWDSRDPQFQRLHNKSALREAWEAGRQSPSLDALLLDDTVPLTTKIEQAVDLIMAAALCPGQCTVTQSSDRDVEACYNFSGDATCRVRVGGRLSKTVTWLVFARKAAAWFIRNPPDA